MTQAREDSLQIRFFGTNVLLNYISRQQNYIRLMVSHYIGVYRPVNRPEQTHTCKQHPSQKVEFYQCLGAPSGPLSKHNILF